MPGDRDNRYGKGSGRHRDYSEPTNEEYYDEEDYDEYDQTPEQDEGEFYDADYDDYYNEAEEQDEPDAIEQYTGRRPDVYQRQPQREAQTRPAQSYREREARPTQNYRERAADRTPQRREPARDPRRSQPPARPRHQRSYPPRRVKEKQPLDLNNVIKLFYLIILLIVVAGVGIGGIFLARQFIDSDTNIFDNIQGPSSPGQGQQGQQGQQGAQGAPGTPNVPSNNNNDNNNDAPHGVWVPPVINTIDAMVLSTTSTDPRGITVLDLSETPRNRTFTLPEDAEIVTRAGQPLPFSQVRTGQIVRIRYDENNNEIERMQESTTARELRARTNVDVDPVARTATVGNEVLNFDALTLVLRQDGQTGAMTNITPMDTITLNVLNTDIWFVQIELSHGLMQFVATEGITNPRIYVGNRSYTSFSELLEPFPMPEGSHTIIISGDNIETFTHIVNIAQGETYVLDLSEAEIELRIAILNMAVTPANATVTINGEAVDFNEPIQVEFGENTIRAEAPGFITHEQTLTITQPTTAHTINLEADVPLAYLTVFTQPENARIYVDGEFVGVSVVTVQVQAGTRTVVARIPGFVDTTQVRYLAAEQDNMMNLMLVPLG
ncbi:MAG: PEGA domain-containing protein [Defluviitaleaceae bacterium]|nr:PEGA domain-containing protein [Defluviitaleaceae bacterium]